MVSVVPKGGMMEKRAVRVSHELWKQIMTQGYESGGIKCTYGLPEDATLVEVFVKEHGSLPDPVFVFESSSWADDLAFSAPSAKSPRTGEAFPVFGPIFQAAEDASPA
jgi:hypothetical protein